MSPLAATWAWIESNVLIGHDLTARDHRRQQFWPPRDALMVLLESVDQAEPTGGGAADYWSSELRRQT
jgi:hypothetical protein